MKNKISYVVVSLIFFNLLFMFFYYFKIVNFLYINFIGVNWLVNIILINFIVVVFDIIYVLFYKIAKLEKVSYVKIVILGFIVGCFFSFLLLNYEDYEVSDYLGIISFFVINILFLSYSLYFEKAKELVFK